MSRPQEKGEAARGHGADVVVRFAIVLKTATTHEANNAAWRVHVRALGAALAPILRSDKSVKVELHDGQFLVNGTLVRNAYADFKSAQFLRGAFAQMRIGGVEFAGPPQEADVKVLAASIHRQSSATAPSFQALLDDLKAKNVRTLLVSPASATSAAPGSGIRDPRLYGVFTFLKGIAAVRDVMEGLGTGKSVGFKHAKRFVQSAVDLLETDRGLLLALTSIKNYENYLYNHSVNVCLLSLVVGSKLGFSKAKLADLGLAALLRDIGKATIPKAILEKQGPLTPEEWAHFQSFPFAAVAGLLRFRGFNDSLLRQVVVAFEHKFRSVRDDRLTERDFSLFSRIAQLADAFDAMTTPRPYRPKPLTPDDALRTIIADRHLTRADPALIKTFIHAIGLYPVGTVVVLDTNELAVVAAPPSDMATLTRPRVRLICDPFGNEMLSAPIVDLAECDESVSPARYPRSISGTLDRWNYGIDVARHLLSDEAAPQLNF